MITELKRQPKEPLSVSYSRHIIVQYDKPQTLCTCEQSNRSEVSQDDVQAVNQELPRADGGSGAWKFLLGAFMIEAFQWGFALSYGVFQDYYSSHPPFIGNKNIPIIGTLATSVVYLGALPMIYLIRLWPQYHRQMVWIGWAMTVLGLLASSFATTVTVLIATQGVLFGVGSTIIYFPVISMLNEWFVTRRGLALGTMQASTGLTGTAMPFALAALLDRYGYATTLRVLVVAIVVLTGPFLPALKGRLPVSQTTRSRKTPLAFLCGPLFYFYSASIFLQGLGHFFPTLYLPSYATSLGYSPSLGALLLALFSLAQVFGQVGNGYLSDNRVPVSVLAFILPLVSCASVFTLWGFGRSLPLLIVFSMIYGFFGGGFVVLWAKMGLELSDDPQVALVTFGIFSSMKGIGNVITGPISAVLILNETRREAYGLEKYRWVVIYCGVCMATCSGTMVILYFVRKLKRTS